MDPLRHDTTAADANRVCVILNPAAGRGQGARRRAELDRALELAAGAAGRPVQWSVVETTAPGTGASLAAEAARSGCGVVAAAGGDGTLGEVLNGLVGTSSRLGVIPFGTGNDFARELGLVGNLGLAARTLFDGMPRRVDVGRAQGRWFLNVAGCGFDARVARRVNQGYRFLRGTAAYVAAVLECLLTLRAAEMCVTVDGEERRLRALLCCVANSPSYGGGMRVAPDARIDDGLFDLCILRDAGRMEFLRAFPRVFRGTHTEHPKVLMLTGRRIEVVSDPPQPVLVDGDVVGATPAEFEISAGAIEVMTPTGASA